MGVIRLSPDTYLSTDDGIIISKDDAERIIKTAVLRQKNLTVQDTLIQVLGRDQQVINLNLQGLNENIAPVNGFLIKVYVVAADGSLQRVYKQGVVDPADGSVVRGSFDQYIEMDIDQ